MLLSVRRRAIIVTIMTVVTLLVSWINPLSAHATNYTFNTTITSGQPGESVGILAVSMCPNTGTKHMVYATLTDSGNNVVSIEGIAETNTAGQWTTGMMPIYDPQLGVGELALHCERLGIVTRNYDTIPFLVTSQTNTTITRNKEAHVWGNVHFQSATSCTPNASVTGAVYGNGQLAPLSTMSDTADTSGHWTLELYVNPTIYGVHNMFHLRVACGGTDYASYMFYVMDDEYVAMGDSYSSGEGTFNYNLAGGACHRSTDGYPHIVAEELSLGLPNLVACSGAVTDDVFNQNPVKTAEDAQLNHLTYDTKVVTLTIGGNDMGFEQVMKRCAHSTINTGYGCSTDSYLVNALNDRRSALAGNATGPTYTPDYTADGGPGPRLIRSLLSVYEAIHDASPDAKIFVAGYPRLFGSDISNYSVTEGNPPGGAACAAPAVAVFSYDDAQWINGQANSLNAVILDAVENAQGQGIDIEYVPSALFTSHGICDSGNAWMNEVVYGGPGESVTLPESFHPTAEGYAYGYGTAFATVMSQ